MDLEQHIRQAYSILEANKMKVKSNYLNHFALEKTFLPDILRIFEQFNFLGHLAAIFQSYLRPSEVEVLDEFEELNENIQKFNQQLGKQGSKKEALALTFDNFDKDQQMSGNHNFLFKEDSRKKKDCLKAQSLAVDRAFPSLALYEDKAGSNLYYESILFYQLLDYDCVSGGEDGV